MKAKQLAEYIIAFLESKGDLISNKKLQKLLYYVEAWSLVHLKGPLVDEDFEAWVHGPVIPEVYKIYKVFGSQIISSTKKLQSPNKKLNLSKDEILLIETVLLKYGALSSFQLEQLSHSEKPWIEARKRCTPFDKCNEKIKRTTMQAYYSKMINE